MDAMKVTVLLVLSIAQQSYVGADCVPRGDVVCPTLGCAYTL